MLVHDTMLKDASYHTGTAKSPMCECEKDKEAVPHILLHCSRFIEARSELEDSVETYIQIQSQIVLVWISYIYDCSIMQ